MDSRLDLGDLVPAGSTVEWVDGKRRLRGVVETYRVIGGLQILSIATTEGARAYVDARRASVEASAGEPPVVEAATTLANAELVATAVLRGEMLRLPISLQLRVLALAVLGQGKQTC